MVRRDSVDPFGSLGSRRVCPSYLIAGVYNVPRSGPFSTRTVQEPSRRRSLLFSPPRDSAFVRHPSPTPRPSPGIRLTRHLRFRSLGEQLPRSRPLFLIFADPIFSKYLLSVFRSRRSRARKEMEQRWEILITPLQGSCVREREEKQKPCRFRSRGRYPTRVATRVRESTWRDERPYRRIFLYFGYFLKYTRKREREGEIIEHSIIRATRPCPL